MYDLIPKNILDTLPKLYDTTDTTDPISQVKLFLPDSNFTCYLVEFSIDEDTCYGYVVGLDNELGYFSLEEILSVKGGLGLGVERDLSFKPTPLSVIKKAA